MAPQAEDRSHESAMITRLAQAAGAGDAAAASELLPLVYDELRRMAAAKLARTPPGQTLQATALVHEAYLRLLGEARESWQSRAEFFFAAARAVQHILVEEARKKASLKRGGGRKRVNLDELRVAEEAPPDEMLALDEALRELEQTDATSHRIVMLRFFTGLSEKESAELTGMSERTLRREWQFARAKLHQRLSKVAEG